MKLIIPFILCLFGCVESLPIESVPATGNHIGKAQVYTEDVGENVERAKPHADDQGDIYLDAASRGIAKALAELAQAIASDTEKTELVNRLAADNKGLATELAAERDQWFGDRLHAWVAWIVGIILAAVVGLWLLLGWRGVSMVKNGLGGWGLLNSLPFANPFVKAALKAEKGNVLK